MIIKISDTNAIFLGIILILNSTVSGSVQKETPETPLIQASKACLTPMVERLIKAGENVNAKDDTNSTALHHALVNGCSQELIKLLINAKADPNIISQTFGTPLHSAVTRAQTCKPNSDDKGVFSLLLNIPNIDVEIKDKYNKTALTYAKLRLKILTNKLKTIEENYNLEENRWFRSKIEQDKSLEKIKNQIKYPTEIVNMMEDAKRRNDIKNIIISTENILIPALANLISQYDT